MRWALLLSFWISAAASATQTIYFNCMPMEPAPVQGEERYIHLAFLENGGATLEIASAATPYESPVSGMKLLANDYSDESTYASAIWADAATGIPTVRASFAYLGTWWGGHLRFERDVETASLKFTKGLEYDLHCLAGPKPIDLVRFRRLFLSGITL